MNRFHTQSFVDCVLRNSVSMKSIKMQSYGGGSKFSTNSGSTYLLEKFEIKLKNTFLKTFPAFFMISSVGTFLCRNLQYCLRTTSRPSIWEILGKIPTISVVTRIAPTVFSPKSHLYFMYNIFLLSLLAANDDLTIPKCFLLGYQSSK